MNRYRVTANFTVYANSPEEARQLTGTCIELWDEDSGIANVQGIGDARGSVSTEAIPPKRSA